MNRKIAIFFLGIYILCTMCACSLMNGEGEKVRDLDFTILGEEKIPEALRAIIDERKVDDFKLTYSDKEYLYICIGYGEQSTGGYSIAVNQLYLGDNAIYCSTSLLGPESAQRSNSNPSYPYIVIKTEYLDETVIYQ
ncbi:MAG: protease complex subunit PrcB family protein [Lachnospiraceae bacterium]|nr:protease complex subunit PrcB family protein [Lachnospiraceae bacterium]